MAKLISATITEFWGPPICLKAYDNGNTYWRTIGSVDSCDWSKLPPTPDDNAQKDIDYREQRFHKMWKLCEASEGHEVSTESLASFCKARCEAGSLMNDIGNYSIGRDWEVTRASFIARNFVKIESLISVFEALGVGYQGEGNRDEIRTEISD